MNTLPPLKQRAYTIAITTTTIATITTTTKYYYYYYHSTTTKYYYYHSTNTIVYYYYIRRVMELQKLCVWRTHKGERGDVWLGQHRVPVQGERWTTSHTIASRATVLLSRTTYILFRFFPLFFSCFTRCMSFSPAETTMTR